MKRLLVMFILICLISCKGQKVINRIHGVWVFESKINNLDLKDTSQLYGHRYPIILDFKEDGDLIFKNYADKDTVFNWYLKSDTLLTFDSLDYTIHSLNEDGFSLIDYNANDTFWLSFKRPPKIKLNYSKAEIEKLLLSNIWSIGDSINHEWATHFEYFDNKTMIYRYKYHDPDLNDTTDYLQLETWGVDVYKDYYFLYSYHDMLLGNGNIDIIKQVIDINDTSYTILDPYRDYKNTRFHVKRNYVTKNENLNTLIGNWKSYNSKDRIYSKYIPKRAIEYGRVMLLEGDLNLMINEKTLTFKIDTLKPITYNWQLSKDGKILILEEHINEPERKGIHVERADILKLTDNKLVIRLFDNNYFTDKDKPSRYILNLIQEFDRVE